MLWFRPRPKPAETLPNVIALAAMRRDSVDPYELEDRRLEIAAKIKKTRCVTENALRSKRTISGW